MTLKRVILERWTGSMTGDSKQIYSSCVIDIPEDSPLVIGARIVGIEEVK